jgi:adenosylcobinamide-GDP ribazoletransferase
MIALLAAFQFLTIFPPIVRREFTPAELGRSTAYYPIVGLTLGAILIAVRMALDIVIPPMLSTAITITAWVILTRGFHFDGFLDTIDGLFGGFTPERRLEIMRDSLVGAFGVVGGGLLLLVKFSATFSLDNLLYGLFLAPVLGRWAITLAVAFYPYAREAGLGRDIKDHTSWPQALFATLFAVIIAWLTAQWLGIGAVILAFAVLSGWLFFVGKRIPGLTGDIYGASCEIIEVTTLIFFSLKLFP